MNKNGTDRDVALSILDALDACSNLLQTINANLYSPYILTQPTNQTVAIDATCTFTINAVHVASYQWQYLPAGGTWTDGTGTADQATFSFVVRSTSVYARYYRCKLTGTDGTVAYSDLVQVLQPDS